MTMMCKILHQLPTLKALFANYLVSEVESTEDASECPPGRASELLISSGALGVNSDSSVKAVAMERTSNGFDTVWKHATILAIKCPT